jgi:hypothetical protein
LVTIWAGRANPQPNLPDGYALASTTIDEPGTLDAPKRLATLTVSPRLPPGAVSGNPSVYFDPILNAPPWPLDVDDNLNRRMDALLTIARTFIEVLEETLGTEESTDGLEALDALIPSAPTAVWLPVRFDDPDQEQESRRAILESDQGMAIYANDDGVMTYLALRDDRVVGREIPDAEALPPSRGIALQVKARSSATADTADRARSWLLKNAAAGHVPLSGGVLDTVRVSGSDHAVMSSGLATSSSDRLATWAMDRSDR